MWLLRAAIAAETALRASTVKGLQAWLDDKREMRRTLPPGAERVPPRSRVCDDAYLGIHKLEHFGETMDEAREVRDALLFASDEQRDAIIRKARESRTW